jgi:hypothetical protein
MQATTDHIPDSIEPGDNILLLCRSTAGDWPAACVDLLTLGGPERTDVLWVTLTDPPHEQLAVWERRVGTDTPRRAVVSGHDGAHSVGDGPESLRDWPVEAVSSPADLTQLGVRIVDRLSDWESAQSDRRAAVCFHSLTELLRHVGVERAFKFLHVLGSHPATDDATIHYHLDPGTHGEQTTAMLAEVVDAVCEYDGEWKVSG